MAGQKGKPMTANNMSVAEYNRMMEANGTPKVWVVKSGHSGGDGNVYTRLYKTEKEALEAYSKIPSRWFRSISQTWDIWNWTKRMQ